MEEYKKDLVSGTPTGSTPADMIRAAVINGADLDKLEKLLSLQERFEANEAKKAYHSAMAKFKENPPEIEKDKKVGYSTSSGKVGYSHASLANVVNKITSELSKHGLSASWKTKQNGVIVVTCVITHKLGHSEETSLSANADSSGSKNSIQAIGSTITYLERYTLLAILGLATHDQDDDGETATPKQYISDKQLSSLRDALADIEAREETFCKSLGVDRLELLPVSRLGFALEAIKARREKREGRS